MRTAVPLGLSQLINRGVLFYLLGAFGPAMVKEFAWSSQQVFAGLSVAMVVMGLTSPFSGGLVERFSGRRFCESAPYTTRRPVCCWRALLRR